MLLMVCPLKAQFPGEEGIIFTGINKPNSDIYWLSIDGLQWENLTQTFTNYEYGPTVSPDGTQIAFVKLPVGGAPGDLYILDLQTRKLRRITDHPAHDTSPAWSPDGKQIAFVSNRSGEYRIHLLDLNGGEPILLRPNLLTVHDSGPSWSPDGTRLAFHAVMAEPRNNDLLIFDLHTGQVENLTQTPEVHELDPVWSPDGRSIAFWINAQGGPKDENTEVYLMDVATKKVTNLSRHPSSDGFPSWSPDGQTLLFLSNRLQRDRFLIYTMDPKGNRQRLLSELKVDVPFPSPFYAFCAPVWFRVSLSISPAGKLPTTWGAIKQSVSP